MNSTTLVHVFTGTFNNKPILLCDAKDLHAFLEVGTRFNDWIIRRIAEYGFIEGEDFYSNLGKTPESGRPATTSP
jgi:anti-repressor protein